MHPALGILAGIGLAACAGLRAFLPILLAGLAARYLDWPLVPALEWMKSDAALIIFGAATLLEIAADKIPLVDNALDAAHTVVGPLAGALVAFSPLSELPTPLAAALGIIAGATVAGGVHALAASTRVGGTALTGGAANPILSVIEDGIALVLALVAILAPLLVLGVLFALALGVMKLFRRRPVA